MSDDKKKCFVITPIGEEGSTIRRHIDGIIRAAIRPALEDKYEVKVAHEINTTGSINNQVIVEIYESDLVVANLTELNPNVMYELAIRHAFKKPVIMIMEKNNKGLPFDVVNERTIFYINDSQGTIDLRESIKKSEESIDEKNIANPIVDALNTYVTDESILKNVGDKKDADVLKAILKKINRLEEMQYAKREEIAIARVAERIEVLIDVIFSNKLTNRQSNNFVDGICTHLVQDLASYMKFSLHEETYHYSKTNEKSMKISVTLEIEKKFNSFNSTMEAIEESIERYLKLDANVEKFEIEFNSLLPF